MEAFRIIPASCLWDEYPTFKQQVERSFMVRAPREKVVKFPSLFSPFLVPIRQKSDGTYIYVERLQESGSESHLFLAMWGTSPLMRGGTSIHERQALCAPCVIWSLAMTLVLSDGCWMHGYCVGPILPREYRG